VFIPSLFLGEEATNFCCFCSKVVSNEENKSEDAGGRGPPYRTFCFKTIGRSFCLPWYV
jgi:hypothetical protein